MDMRKNGIKRNHTGIVLALLAVLLAVFVTAIGCSPKIEEPSYDNPLDPNGPTGGDPFNVEASASQNRVLIRWDQVQHPDIVSYIVLHSTDGESYTVAEDTVVAHLPNRDVNSLIHTEPVPNAINWYKVQALSSEGFASSSRAVQADTAWSQPFFQIAGGNSTTPTRFVDLTILTTAGDSIEIATNEVFTGSTVLPATPDVTIFLPWDLGLASDNDSTFAIYLRVQTGPLFSPVAQRNITSDFAPRFSIFGKENGIDTQVIDLLIENRTGNKIDATGIDSMRFAASEAALATTAWAPGDTLFSGYVLADSPMPQEIHGEFKGDFGYYTKWSETAQPDDLTDAAFTVMSLDNNSNITDTGEVKIVSSLGALEMRFSEDPAFAGLPWIAYNDTALLALSEGAGLKVIYGQFRNFWAQSPTVSDIITRVTQELEVAFYAPMDGANILGGNPFAVSGFATLGTGQSNIDTVLVDFGDGLGFQQATGTESWSIMWDVPLFTQDTPITLRARAVADSLSKITTIEVTVTQLVVAFTAPVPGAFIASDSLLTVAGSAAPILGGADLDSIVVGLAGTDTSLAGDSSWSVDWQVPVVSENLEVLLTATAWAGGEFSPPDTVAITITPESLP